MFPTKQVLNSFFESRMVYLCKKKLVLTSNPFSYSLAVLTESNNNNNNNAFMILFDFIYELCVINI